MNILMKVIDDKGITMAYEELGTITFSGPDRYAWVYYHPISVSNPHDVEPARMGLSGLEGMRLLYTGFTDKNGTKVFNKDRMVCRPTPGSTQKVIYSRVEWNQDSGQWWISPERDTPSYPLCNHVKLLEVCTEEDGK